MAIAEDQAASDAPLREPESDRSAPDLPARARTRVRKFATRVLMIFAPCALITGIIAIIDIRKHPERHGMGRAIFGVVMGAVFSAILAAAVLGSV